MSQHNRHGCGGLQRHDIAKATPSFEVSATPK